MVSRTPSTHTHKKIPHKNAELNVIQQSRFTGLECNYCQMNKNFKEVQLANLETQQLPTFQTGIGARSSASAQIPVCDGAKLDPSILMTKLKIK